MKLNLPSHVATLATLALFASGSTWVRSAEAQPCPEEWTLDCPQWVVVETQVPPGICDGFPLQFAVADIGEDGTAVGVLTCPFSGSREAAIWIPGEPISTLPMPEGTSSSTATGIDLLGRMCGQLERPDENGDLRMHLWLLDGDTVTESLPPGGWDLFQVVGMSSDGTVCGTLIGESGFQVFRWEAGEFDLIESPFAPADTIASIVTDAGTIVGNVYGHDGIEITAFTLEGGSWRTMPIPADARAAIVRDAHSADLVLVAMVYPGLVQVPAVWRGDAVSLIEGQPGQFIPNRMQDDAVVYVGEVVPGGDTQLLGVVDGRPVATVESLVAGLPSGYETAIWRSIGDVMVGQSLSGSPNELIQWRAVRVAPLAGDVSCDGVVDFGDLIALLSAWSCDTPRRADLDRDGKIDVSDLEIILESWSLSGRGL